MSIFSESRHALSSFTPHQMKGGVTLSVGPKHVRLQSNVASLCEQASQLYQGYPVIPADEIADFQVNVAATSFARRLFRPKVVAWTDVPAPIKPLPARMAMLALEMGINWQVAMTTERALVLHAGSLERAGRSIIFPGNSGSGKSTLAAALGLRDWRFLGDEFALVDLASGKSLPMPRPISLKNQSIDLMMALAPIERFTPRYEGTPKGTLAFLRPPPEALARMSEPATPALLLFPTYAAGVSPILTPMGRAEAFVRLVAGGANYDRLGQPGFEALARLVETCPAAALHYGSLEDANALVEQAWECWVEGKTKV